MEAQPISTEKPEEIAIDGFNMDSVASSLLQTNQQNTTEDSANPNEDVQELSEEVSVEDDDAEELENEAEAEDDSEDEDSEAEEAETEEAEHQELFTVKVDGQEQKVTLDDLKRSYSGQAYIQQGMQQAAEQKKQAEEAYVALQNERQQLNQLLNQINSGQVLSPPKEPDQALFKKDPIGYMEAKMKYDGEMKSFNEQQSQLQQFQAQQNQQMQQAMQLHLQEEVQKLSEKMPEFKDSKKADEIKKNLLDYGQSIGYSADELNNVIDHRAFIVLNKARLYDQLNANKPKAQSKAKNARPMLKSGVKKSSSTQSQKAKEQAVSRMRKTGSIDDVASFLIS
jgi:DNA repair exonuclease SbcCD ATPase subunit